MRHVSIHALGTEILPRKTNETHVVRNMTKIEKLLNYVPISESVSSAAVKRCAQSLKELGELETDSSGKHTHMESAYGASRIGSDGKGEC